MTAAQAHIALIEAQTAFFVTTYKELLKNDQLEQLDAVAGIFGQAYATREQYMDFVENFRDNIAEASALAKDLKLIRNDDIMKDLGLLHLVQPTAQSDLAKLANAVTMYIWIRRAGKAWRAREHARMAEEHKHVAAA